MENVTKRFRKLFEKDFRSHDKAINDESPVMPIVNNFQPEKGLKAV